MPAGVEWGLIAVTGDLRAEARYLAQLAHEYGTEEAHWTVPRAREIIHGQHLAVSSWAQEAALSADFGDYWSRMEALQLAGNRRRTAQANLRLWIQRGDLWNEHRLRPEPAILKGTLIHE